MLLQLLAAASNSGQELVPWASGLLSAGMVGYLIKYITVDVKDQHQDIKLAIKENTKVQAILADSILLFLLHAKNTDNPIRDETEKLKKQLDSLVIKKAEE